MQTQDTNPVAPVTEHRPGPSGRRRLIPALAGALAVVLIAVGVWAATPRSGSDVAASTPVGVAERFEAEVLTADWAAVHNLFADGATWQILMAGGDSPVITLADELPDSADVLDWDGDGVVREMDFFASLGAEMYAGGTTEFLSCSQVDAATAVCNEIREGYAFENPGHSATWTFTTSEGLIQSIAIELQGDGINRSRVTEYQQWIQESRPEVEEELFTGFAFMRITPDTIDLHRELATEWLAAQ